MSVGLAATELSWVLGLIEFLEGSELPEGLIPNITLSLDFMAKAEYSVVCIDGGTWVLQPSE